MWKTENKQAVLEGFYATARYESATFAIIAALLLTVAIVVEAFSLRGTTTSVAFGSLAAVALVVLGYRVIRSHRNRYRREAELLGEAIRSVLGEDEVYDASPATRP